MCKFGTEKQSTEIPTNIGYESQPISQLKFFQFQC